MDAAVRAGTTLVRLPARPAVDEKVCGEYRRNSGPSHVVCSTVFLLSGGLEVSPFFQDSVSGTPLSKFAFPPRSNCVPRFAAASKNIKLHAPHVPWAMASKRSSVFCRSYPAAWVGGASPNLACPRLRDVRCTCSW